ncbi:hypothetical protein HY407_00630 [Candidatus Gottesmanbacteria bacterium]|nr:hypothetical protein [Candidatus Gottesmanbacteria bacterium]
MQRVIEENTTITGYTTGFFWVPPVDSIFILIQFTSFILLYIIYSFVISCKYIQNAVSFMTPGLSTCVARTKQIIEHKALPKKGKGIEIVARAPPIMGPNICPILI